MFKITFQYFNRYDERVEWSLHGQTKREAYKKAYSQSLKDGDGDFSVVCLRKMIIA